ncbi:hypothetical protein HYX12_00205 [Candidatus Woesearchaeota archaeon]|nr:hypothetical protein [Candidatus Woesearchaeota archaeon]
MGLEHVKEEVLTGARSKASEIMENAQHQVTDIQQKAKGEINAYRKEAESNHQHLVAGMERKILAQARFDAQRMQMNAKKEAINAVLLKAKDDIAALPKREKQTFLKHLLAKAKIEIDVDKIFLNNEDLGLLSGVDVGVAKISGGIIAQNKDGTITVDLSVDELLDVVKNEKMVELSEALFGRD